MSRKFDWNNKKIGLVLSGGGAKGAYQIGMFRALEELGLSGQIEVIAGTSIGAMNAAAYALHGISGMRDILYGFEQGMSALRRNVTSEKILESKQKVKQGIVTVEEFAVKPEFSEFDTELLLEEMREMMTDEQWKHCSTSLYICAYNMNRKMPEYFHLNEMNPEDARKMILASASLPFIFPPVAFDGSYYLDGGVVPEVCRPNVQPADKIPLKAILGEALDAILVCFLNPADEIEHTQVSEHTDYLELRPSRPLEAYAGEGTLDFTKERLLAHETLGYQDTKRLFEMDFAQEN